MVRSKENKQYQKMGYDNDFKKCVLAFSQFTQGVLPLILISIEITL